MDVIVSRVTYETYLINFELDVQKKKKKKPDVFAIAVKVCFEMLKFILPRMVPGNKSESGHRLL